jgi:hypothetical protein
MKDQFRIRSLGKDEGVKRLRILMVGASQMGGMGDEMKKQHGGVCESRGRQLG